MKKLNYILFVLCLGLYSCGMTDVWEDWDGQGVMSEDRLKPSELKKVLLAADGWKMTYEGVTLYYEFDGEGTVISNTDETILKDKVESSYTLGFKGEKTLLINIEDLGALRYLSDGQKTFYITAFNEQTITATGKGGTPTMTLTRATAAEIKANDDKKSVELFMKDNGVIRDTNDKFLAHYAISGEPGYKKIKISVLENRVLKHYDQDLTVNISDEDATLIFDAITMHGKTISQISFNIDSKAMTIGSGLKVAINKNAVDYFTGSSYETHKLNGHKNIGDAKEELWQELKWGAIGDLEINNRDERPLVFCPGPENAIWYIFFDANLKTTDEIDRIYFNRTAGRMPFGGDNRVAELEGKVGEFLNAWFHTDGLYMIRETSGNDSNLYFISPTTDNWIKAVK